MASRRPFNLKIFKKTYCPLCRVGSVSFLGKKWPYRYIISTHLVILWYPFLSRRKPNNIFSFFIPSILAYQTSFTVPLYVTLFFLFSGTKKFLKYFSVPQISLQFVYRVIIQVWWPPIVSKHKTFPRKKIFLYLHGTWIVSDIFLLFEPSRLETTPRFPLRLVQTIDIFVFRS